jgi:hypothetical protein
MEDHLNSWTHKFLTFPARVLLIKFVLTTMPIYLFFVLASLVNIQQRICAIQRNFLWGGEKWDRKWDLVAWDRICTPKNMGGLGIRDPQKMGQALAEKIFWRWNKNP